MIILSKELSFHALVLGEIGKKYYKLKSRALGDFNSDKGIVVRAYIDPESRLSRKMIEPVIAAAL